MSKPIRIKLHVTPIWLHCLFCFLFIHQDLHAQFEAEIDSLRQAIEVETNDTVRLNLINLLFRPSHMTSIEKGLVRQELSNDIYKRRYFSSDQGGITGVMP